MNSKTKIIVLHMKEIIYTVIFATLGILILCLLFFMFSGNRHSSVSDKKYTPGVYTSSFTLGNEDLELEVSVSDTSINSIRISNLSETVTAMYPLLQPSLENLADQICKSQSLDHLTLSSDKDVDVMTDPETTVVTLQYVHNSEADDDADEEAAEATE